MGLLNKIEEHSGKLLVAIGILTYISQTYNNAPILGTVNFVAGFFAPLFAPAVDFIVEWWNGLINPQTEIPPIAALLMIVTSVGFPLVMLINNHKLLTTYVSKSAKNTRNQIEEIVERGKDE